MAKRGNRKAETVSNETVIVPTQEAPVPAETVETTEVVAAPPAEAETVTPAAEPTPEPVADPAPAAETVTAAAPAAPVYWVNADRPFRPRKGFETVLYAALADQRSEAEVIAHLLASGDYRRVAPKAAELRPTKPTRFLLKTWTAAGILRRSL